MKNGSEWANWCPQTSSKTKIQQWASARVASLCEKMNMMLPQLLACFKATSFYFLLIKTINLRLTMKKANI